MGRKRTDGAREHQRKDMEWSCGRLLRASERSFIIRLGLGWETVGG